METSVFKVQEVLSPSLTNIIAEHGYKEVRGSEMRAPYEKETTYKEKNIRFTLTQYLINDKPFIDEPFEVDVTTKIGGRWFHLKCDHLNETDISENLSEIEKSILDLIP